MRTNYPKSKHHVLVHACHDALKASNPDLNAVRHEVLRLHGVDLTESEVGKHLSQPLESGRRGTSATSGKADAASRCACQASKDAEQSPSSTTHSEADKAHATAATLHRAAARYHDAQSDFHSEKASETSDAEMMLDCNNATTPMRSRLAEDGKLPDVIHYMPAGVHTITPSQGGRPVIVTVDVNELSAERLEQQRQALEATGGKPFFSIQHNTQIAAFWPTKFFWDTRIDATGSLVSGVWAEGEWTKSGREAVEGKDFRTFSPTFFVNAVRNDPANPVEVVSNPRAKLNMGALENDPAFQKLSPLWSGRA